MQAKVKDSYQFGTVIAFSGHEFVKYEWRDIPFGNEDAAIIHPFLDIKDDGKDVRVTSKDRLAEVMNDLSSEVVGFTEEVLEVTDDSHSDHDEDTAHAKKTRKRK